MNITGMLNEENERHSVISENAMDAAYWMQTRIETLISNLNTMSLSVSKKIDLVNEIRQLIRDRRRLLGIKENWVHERVEYDRLVSRLRKEGWMQ